MQHARLSPSSSSRWLTCTASVEATAQYENKSNSASAWGTTVHGIGELLLKDKPIPEVVEGNNVDKEMMECAEEYVDYCRSLMCPDSITLIEEKFDLTFIAPETFGTGDFTVLNGTHLDIVDLKTGHNIVKAENNSQLQLYALGAIYDLEDLGYEIETVTLHIVQTRANHIDTWDVNYEDLMEFKDFASTQAKNILEGKTEFNPSAKGCKWCPHKTNCDALYEHTEKIVKGTFDDLEEIEGKANLISNDHIKKILDNAELIEGFLKAVKEVALDKAMSGEEIEGYKVVASRSNRKWNDEEKVKEYLDNLDDGMNYYQEPKLKPLTTILKTLKNDNKITEFVVKPEGKPTLAPITDKRKPLEKVSECFDDLS